MKYLKDVFQYKGLKKQRTQKLNQYSINYYYPSLSELFTAKPLTDVQAHSQVYSQVHYKEIITEEPGK